jgi:hypothetical protein
VHIWLFRQILAKSGFLLFSIVNILQVMMMMITTTINTINDNDVIIAITTILFGTAYLASTDNEVT